MKYKEHPIETDVLGNCKLLKISLQWPTFSILWRNFLWSLEAFWKMITMGTTRMAMAQSKAILQGRVVMLTLRPRNSFGGTNGGPTPSKWQTRPTLWMACLTWHHDRLNPFLLGIAWFLVWSTCFHVNASPVCTCTHTLSLSLSLSLFFSLFCIKKHSTKFPSVFRGDLVSPKIYPCKEERSYAYL